MHVTVDYKKRPHGHLFLSKNSIAGVADVARRVGNFPTCFFRAEATRFSAPKPYRLWWRRWRASQWPDSGPRWPSVAWAFLAVALR